MHQLTSLRSYFYGCDVLSEQKKMIFFPTKNPVDVRREVVYWQLGRYLLVLIDIILLVTILVGWYDISVGILSTKEFGGNSLTA
jgi:hypothetical protein